jgi:hypothetical protein
VSGLLVARRGALAKPSSGGTVLRRDNFTDAAVALENHTSDSGHTWVPSGGGSSHQLTGSGTVYRFSSPVPYLLGAAVSSANYRIDAVLDVKSVITGDLFIIYGRSTDATNTYRAFVSLTAITLDKLIANSATTLGSPFSNTLTTGAHTLSLLVTGTSISVSWDAVQVIAPVTDATYAGPGKVGLRVGGTGTTQSTTTGVHCNSFTVTTI